jgi:hypothetical protein
MKKDHDDLFLSILEKRILADAILTAQHFYAVRSALCETLIDALHFHAGKVSSLLRRQHFAVESAHPTVSRNRVPHDALLFDNRDLNSSSLYCLHVVVLESASPLLPKLFQSCKVLGGSCSSLEENRK